MAIFCTHCGTKFTNDVWPRHCQGCGEFTYRNPLPVALAVVPVQGGGLLTVRRDIEPQRGHLCLPGGFMEFGESWQESVVRELREETTIVFGAEQVRLHAVQSSQWHILVFGLLPEIEAAPTELTEETSGYEVIFAPTELAFPNHTAVAAAYFAAV
ncbi:DNA mismatch repair protein MutT [Longispora fulva]|uniref:ADP-ribose pyrophosphatase YjhB (NUDIX family) n=1 Tax=Longispora fulva TaxID=619741 RepID=A0A8J7GYB6_9ACTN|nr:NUDIX domain-containing protein [Longispora fulva]MBG6141395.1 ADP-ribose pyrophosphatase YjhB (NUDIX family) [Longispora fulva]GIG59455.1 DNA mismatch repair protein MutT [Longispora fulva]